MQRREFTSKVSSIFSTINEVTNYLRDVVSAPISKSEIHRRIKLLERLNNAVSLLNKFSFFAYPDYYSNDEVSDISSKIDIIDNYMSAIKNEVFQNDNYARLNSINDDLIKYTRISRLIQETDTKQQKDDGFENKIKEQLALVVNLKNEIDLNLSNVRGILINANETQQSVINLVNELRDEYNSLAKSSSEVEFVVTKSKSFLTSIENTNETLKQAEKKLADLSSKNNKVYSEWSNLTESSKSRIDELLENEEKIIGIKKEVSNEIEKAQDMITKANAALNLSGTYRLSRHFKNSYILANKNKRFWSVSSIISALICMAFVLYMLIEMNSINSIPSAEQNSHLLLLFFARFSMVPILIGFFAFCAVQYVKQNNISEDYAHKKLLSETLISFKQELIRNDSDKTSVFMDSILKNILTPPLNANNKKIHEIEIAKINEFINSTNQLNKEMIDKILPGQEKGKE
ncbi:TPA: hypothetical protein MAS79_002285 [Klebsiella pneumoniae]|uniref:hypothetical protein n=1 Tax=Klebsiella pneumoniae TaxID=573 RepID=UPI0034E06B15|nr:hypothetical protein [Klebsiella pneumoniae]